MDSTSGEFLAVDDATLSSGDSIMGEAVALARLGPGKPLGPMLVLARLNVGTAGVLYAVYDPRIDERRVVRLLRPRSSGKNATDELRREAKALAAVHHQNLARIHAVTSLHGVVCMTMDHLRGGSLRNWLEAEPRSWSQVLEAFRAIGSALGVVHRAGIVHGDLRPRHVLFDAHGVPQIVDFDLGRPAPSTRPTRRSSPRQEDTKVESLHEPLMRTGERVGVPAYMSPEHYAGEPLDARADQFSYCAMLYEALYGQLPFASRTVQGLFQAIADGRVQPPPGEAGVPAWIFKVIARGLAHDPAQRWPSTDALLDALADDRSARRGRRFGAAAITLALAAGLVAIAHFQGAAATANGSTPSARPEATPASPPAASTTERAPLDDEGLDVQLAALAHTVRERDDAHSIELACELGLRVGLRRLDALEAAGRDAELHQLIEHMRALAGRVQKIDPRLATALARWDIIWP